MKRGLWIACLALMALAAWLGWCHWMFAASPPDEELSQTPHAGADVTVSAPTAPVALDTELMKNTNLFDPERGRAKVAETGNAAPPERPNFELVGICSLGDSSGAIIDRKNEVGGDPKKVRRYYVLGSEVGNGFILDTVTDQMVILRRDGEVLELKVGRSRFGEQAKGSASLERTGISAPVAEPQIVQTGSSEPMPPSEDNNGGTR